MHAHTLIVSDIHLEIQDCQAGLLLNLLRSYEYERLIVAGDLYEKHSRIGDKQFEVVKYLRENSDRIIYIDGNHDPLGIRLINEIVGVNAVKRFEWEAGRKKLCVVHGHQFDRFCFVFNERMIDRTLLSVISFLRKIDKHRNHVAGWMDALHKTLSFRIARKTKRYAKRRGFDVIICGHTHRAGHFAFYDTRSRRTIEYFDCGCWVGEVCSFVTVDKNGKAELHHIDLGKAPQ